MTKAIWWIRRDLRLTDNPALSAAIDYAYEVIPLFIIDRRLLNSAYASEKRTAFYFASLQKLDEDLQKRGSKLIVREGLPNDVLTSLVQTEGVSVIYAQQDYSPFAVRRDQELAAILPLKLTGGLAIHPPGNITKADGSPYTVFTPYSRKWKSAGPIERSQILPAPTSLSTPQIASEPLPTIEVNSIINELFPPGEHSGKVVLGNFVKGIGSPLCDYAKSRDFPSTDGTSRLSPYLRFGLISARLAALAAYETIEQLPLAKAGDGQPEKSGPEVWLNELIWRDFYISILAYFPRVRRSSFRPDYDLIQWSNDEHEFEAWCQGKTGYPFIDAAMRQLLTTGWMHNRARMAVASFLVKDLLIDWRWGERWFMQQLIDGDPSANNGGWQWSAGTGTDAAPYFRIFNPISQGKSFDSQGDYIRQYVPELAQVPAKYIHEPWLMPQNEQSQSGCVMGQTYPMPIVDHGWARERTLSAYKAVKR